MANKQSWRSRPRWKLVAAYVLVALLAAVVLSARCFSARSQASIDRSVAIPPRAPYSKAQRVNDVACDRNDILSSDSMSPTPTANDAVEQLETLLSAYASTGDRVNPVEHWSASVVHSAFSSPSFLDRLFDELLNCGHSRDARIAIALTLGRLHLPGIQDRLAAAARRTSEPWLCDALVSALVTSGTGSLDDKSAPDRYACGLAIEAPRRLSTTTTALLLELCALDCPDSVRSSAALWFLYADPPSSAIDKILDAVEARRDDGSDIKWLMAAATRQVESLGLTEHLLRTAGSVFDHVRSKQVRTDVAISTAGALQPKDISSLVGLTRAANSSDAAEAWICTIRYCLSAHQAEIPPEFVPTVEGYLLSQPTDTVESGLVASLGDVGSPEACAALVRMALQANNAKSRCKAIQELRHFKLPLATANALDVARYRETDPQTREKLDDLLRDARENR